MAAASNLEADLPAAANRLGAALITLAAAMAQSHHSGLAAAREEAVEACQDLEVVLEAWLELPQSLPAAVREAAAMALEEASAALAAAALAQKLGLN